MITLHMLLNDIKITYVFTRSGYVLELNSFS